MPIDWTAKPRHDLQGIEQGIASVHETEGGWKWMVKFGKHNRSGVRKSEVAAKRAADRALEQLQRFAEKRHA